MGLVPLRREDEEWLDLPGPSLEEVRGNLQDMQIVNRFFGGQRVVLLYLRHFLSAIPFDQKLTILDIGTGSADIPRSVVKWIRSVKRDLHIIALDRNSHVLTFARQEIAAYPEIQLIQADLSHLPFPEQSVDITLASLICHHLSPDAVVQLLITLNRISRYGFLINDLQRGYIPYIITWLFTRLISQNHLTRNDGPLSVLRAYRMKEWRAMAVQAGLPGLRFARHPFFRIVVVKEQKHHNSGL